MFSLTLPVSTLFEQDPARMAQVERMADAYEIKFVREYKLDPRKERIFHASNGIIEHNFISFIEENRLFDYLARHAIGHLSFDLGPACERCQFILPLSPTLAKRELLAIAGERLGYIREHFSGLLAVENLNYYRTGLFESVCEPDFIRDFVERFDLYLLLDLAHAAISARNMGRDLYEYLEHLPLRRVIEIHLSRPFIHAFQSVDAHEKPGKSEFEALGWLLPKLAGNEKVHVAIEYYGEADGLCRGYRTLNRLLTANASRGAAA